MTNKELKEYMDRISKKLDKLSEAFIALQTELSTKDKVLDEERRNWNIKLTVVGLFLAALELFLHFRGIR